MSYLFLVRFQITEALKCFRHVGVVIVAFVSVQKVRSIEGVVFVTSLASQCWISTVSFIFCLVFTNACDSFFMLVPCILIK
jgi:hypothetical protein